MSSQLLLLLHHKKKKKMKIISKTFGFDKKVMYDIIYNIR